MMKYLAVVLALATLSQVNTPNCTSSRRFLMFLNSYSYIGSWNSDEY
jgi:hypothetical protein